jgi:hypothetical protein
MLTAELTETETDNRLLQTELVQLMEAYVSFHLQWKSTFVFFHLWRQISTVAMPPKAFTFFVRSNTAVVGSNPTRGMDVCLRLFCLCRWWPCDGLIPPPKESCRLSIWLRNCKTEAQVHHGLWHPWSRVKYKVVPALNQLSTMPWRRMGEQM